MWPVRVYQTNVNASWRNRRLNAPQMNAMHSTSLFLVAFFAYFLSCTHNITQKNNWGCLNNISYAAKLRVQSMNIEQHSAAKKKREKRNWQIAISDNRLLKHEEFQYLVLPKKMRFDPQVNSIRFSSDPQDAFHKYEEMTEFWMSDSFNSGDRRATFRG